MSNIGFFDVEKTHVMFGFARWCFLIWSAQANDRDERDTARSIRCVEQHSVTATMTGVSVKSGNWNKSTQMVHCASCVHRFGCEPHTDNGWRLAIFWKSQIPVPLWIDDYYYYCWLERFCGEKKGKRKKNDRRNENHPNMVVRHNNNRP